MRKTREVLRLRYQKELSMQLIGLSCGISSSTVSDTLERATMAGVLWPLPADMTDEHLEALLYKAKNVKFKTPVDEHRPDWAWVHRELRKGKSVTLQTVWEEYNNEHPLGYGYSWFCEGFAKFRAQIHPVMRQVHKMGEKCFVDYAGPTFQVINPETGEVREAALFVGVLGGSNYTYVEATWDQRLPSWLGSHVRMFEFFGGSPDLIIPDNLKSGVTKADYYEPDINPAYHELATHYGTAVLPARKRKPRDKAKAENGVLLAERWIMAKLRNRTFYTLDSLNEAIDELLTRLNNKPFQKMDGSRKSLFEEHERACLHPLPTERYQFWLWKKARVNIDYHIELEQRYYSVPYQLIHEQVEARIFAETVEVLHKGVRVAVHKRLHHRGTTSTLAEHMPPRHAKMLEWTPERIMIWASKTGPSTQLLVEGIMKSKAHPQQGFRACLGVLRLGAKYSSDRLEAACRRAVRNRAFAYRSVRSILEKDLDLVDQDAIPPRPAILHDNVRGSEYYASAVAAMEVG